MPTEAITRKLHYREPYDAAAVWRFLRARVVPGLEELTGSTYRRAAGLPSGPAVVELTPADGHIRAAFRLTDRRDLDPAVVRCRRLLGLDADPIEVVDTLGADPLLGPLVQARPGLRIPGSVDPFETAIRAVVGQQISVGAARTIAGRMVAGHGTRLPEPVGGVTHTFPTPQTLAGVTRLPMPKSRIRTISTLAAAAAAGTVDLEFGADRTRSVPALLALSGSGRGPPSTWRCADSATRTRSPAPTSGSDPRWSSSACPITPGRSGSWPSDGGRYAATPPSTCGPASAPAAGNRVAAENGETRGPPTALIPSTRVNA